MRPGPVLIGVALGFVAAQLGRSPRAASPRLSPEQARQRSEGIWDQGFAQAQAEVGESRALGEELRNAIATADKV